MQSFVLFCIFESPSLTIIYVHRPKRGDYEKLDGENAADGSDEYLVNKLYLSDSLTFPFVTDQK